MTSPTRPKHWTGFCNMGQCEGTKPRGHNGSPLKTCPFWQECACDCHAVVTKMFEMAGQSRIPVPNPEYIPYQRDFWMPSDDPSYRMPDAAPDTLETVGEAPLQVTPTGRVRKGGLEAATHRAVLAWADLGFAERPDCTVKYLSEQVFTAESDTLDKAPSMGAVAAVLDRWESVGYVLLGRKPVRVIGLTPDGKTKGLDWCKARSKNGK